MARIARVIAVYLPQATTSGRPLGKPDFIETLEKRLGRILKPMKPDAPRKDRLEIWEVSPQYRIGCTSSTSVMFGYFGALQCLISLVTDPQAAPERTVTRG